MFIANPSTTAHTVAWQEKVNVSAGTDYSFSGWAASWAELGGDGVDPSPAQLEFFVNGTQIGSDFTLNSQDGQWSQFSASWNSGTSGTATISIVDMNTAGLGNDFCLDDLVFGVPEQMVLTVQPPTSISAGCPSA